MAPLDGDALLMERDSATWTAAIVWPRAARMKRINGVLQEGEGETGGSTAWKSEGGEVMGKEAPFFGGGDLEVKVLYVSWKWLMICCIWKSVMVKCYVLCFGGISHALRVKS